MGNVLYFGRYTNSNDGMCVSKVTKLLSFRPCLSTEWWIIRCPGYFKYQCYLLYYTTMHTYMHAGRHGLFMRKQNQSWFLLEKYFLHSQRSCGISRRDSITCQRFTGDLEVGKDTPYTFVRAANLIEVDRKTCIRKVYVCVTEFLRMMDETD